ncbi:unnamed protein product [Adineta ricciae]|uniref:Uncharacterized protein n=1 Tax=Adineta ricciae TaxID=249248 RepID=A0A813WMI7_ADIRI|nr:unnamed protein product [Adineta ricciae]
MNSRIFFGILLLPIAFVLNSHFRGGTITWRPLNNTPFGGTVTFLIRQRYSWRRSAAMCTDATIATLGYIGGASLVVCVSGSCGYWTNNMYTNTHCTDFNINLDVSSGEKYEARTYPINIGLSIGFLSCCWFADLTKGANGQWNVINQINSIVRPDGYINTSPVAVTLPIIYKETYIQHVHVVQMSDFDSDVLKCRWSAAFSNVNGYDECADVCLGVSGAQLLEENCTLVFTLTTAAIYSAVALQIEDFYNSAATTPMSSVPLQFLFYGYGNPGGCSTPPAIIGNRPNRACIGTPIGSNVTEYVIVQVYCAGKTIIDFITSTPVGMTKSTILNPSPGIYELILSWVPTADQLGPQGFCAGAIDNTQIQSNQWCITFLVGFDSPDIIRPKLVQGSASPIGTIFQYHSIFSIQTTRSVSRPTRNYTFISFYDSTTKTLVQKFDCGWAPEVTYTGLTTVVKFTNPPWIPGHFYYVTFDSGVASGTDFCHPESAPVTDPTFWTFNIWNPAVSSTTTTTTTPFTTVTVTTRLTSTTTINTLLTTTGIVVTSTIPSTTTTSTTSTTTSVTTATTTTKVTVTTPSTVAVIYATNMEDLCKQPILILTVAGMAVIAPVHILVIRTVAQRIVRPTLSFVRAESRTDAEAGSVASGNDAFSKKEHAEETRWARRHDAEQIAKYRSEHPAGAKVSPQQRLADLENEKRRIEQEIADLKRQQR